MAGLNLGVRRDLGAGLLARAPRAPFFIVVANIVVDVLYAYLDPRVRY